jgi:hypothetical protein
VFNAGGMDLLPNLNLRILESYIGSRLAEYPAKVIPAKTPTNIIPMTVPSRNFAPNKILESLL